MENLTESQVKQLKQYPLLTIEDEEIVVNIFLESNEKEFKNK